MTYNELAGQADYIVAHNISFDEKILGAELLRKGIKSDFGKKQKLCTMNSSKKIVYYELIELINASNN